MREAFARLHPMDAMRLKNTSGSVDTTFAQQRLDLFTEGWQACAEQKDKRIAEFEAECISFGIQINNASLKIDELTKQNKELVEALKETKDWLNMLFVWADKNMLDRHAVATYCKQLDTKIDKALAKVK